MLIVTTEVNEFVNKKFSCLYDVASIVEKCSRINEGAVVGK